MPDDLSQLALSDQVRLLESDVELHSLLGNTASAELEMAALSNQLDAAPIPQADRIAAANKAQVEQLIADGAFPTQGRYEGEQYIPGLPGNVTAQLLISSLDPQRYEAEMLRATPVKQTGMTQEEVNRVNARVASMQAAGAN